MALVKPVIFQVVGYQNSGKTTIISKLIHQLNTDGINVVTIKHHGHGGKPNVVQNKDSSRHLDSGALAALVEGNGRMLLQAEKWSWTLEEKVQLVSLFKPDVILLEGYKKESFPKLLLLRTREDLELLKIVDNIRLVISWEKSLIQELEKQTEFPWFFKDDKRSIRWITHFIKNQL